jgi:hypothetical protein
MSGVWDLSDIPWMYPGPVHAFIPVANLTPLLIVCAMGREAVVKVFLDVTGGNVPPEETRLLVEAICSPVDTAEKCRLKIQKSTRWQSVLTGLSEGCWFDFDFGFVIGLIRS